MNSCTCRGGHCDVAFVFLIVVYHAVIGVASINPTTDSRPHIAFRVRLELDLEQALNQDAIRWGKTLASPPKLAISLVALSSLISK